MTATTLKPTSVDSGDTGTAGSSERRPGLTAVGELIRKRRQLTDAQVEQIVAYQRERNLRFVDAAVELNLATRDDVLGVLSQQFQYPYGPVKPFHGSDELFAAKDPLGDQAETLRELRNQLLESVFADTTKRATCLVSSDRHDGRTYLAANLAASFAQMGGKTLLIDANLRTPRLQAVLGIGAGPGLGGLLAGNANADLVRPIQSIPGLFLIAAGQPQDDPLLLLQSPRFSLLLSEMLGKFDAVLIDTPANSAGPDARIIAARAGAALVLGRKGHTQLAALRVLVGRLQKGRVLVAGAVVNEH